MELRNRLVMSPMENSFGTPDGRPSQRSIDYFAARARGGVALITLGACAIDERHKEVPASLHFANDEVIADHRALVDAVHEHGAKIQPQLAHAGPDGLGPEMHQIEALGPSRVQSYLTGTTSQEISAQGFRQVVDLYRAAAVRVREAGYDGIELHAAHGYMLLGSFLTPWRNARKDEYSARKPETRTRAIVEVIRAIKSEVGEDFPLTLRISGYERIAGGRESFDTARIAPVFAAAGVDAFHVSGGVIDRLVTQMVNGAQYPDGLNAACAEAVRRVVDVPVIAVGRIHDPALAAQMLEEGRADLIAMGRPLLADPELPNKVKAGRAMDVRRCISCENCIDSLETSYALECAVNPRTGREIELEPRLTTRRKHVVVIGSGPGGLEAARVAAERGHRVSLYERNRYLGGALVMAATVHPENQPFLDYLLREVERLPVQVQLGWGLGVPQIEALEPDAVIVATGGKVVAPKITGDHLPHVLTGSELRRLLCGELDRESAVKLPRWQRAGVRLLGGPVQTWITPQLLRRVTRAWMPLGHRIVIIGADLAAIELAEFLAARGRYVAILETGAQIAPEVGMKRRDEHMMSLDRAKIAVNTGVCIDRIERDGVVLLLDSGREHKLQTDNVILAGQVEPDTTLYDALCDRVPEVHAVGDCTGLGLIRKATLEGAQVATAL
ncbi:MAG: FAD-dependent oxidoreductase [Deltaproteobacteria bacterium]|nr:FAD-dependent oxidoreductase [Deltaproteobacteria bacterium]